MLADVARTRMRPKIGLLEEAFAGLRLGTFDDHHRFLLARMLARIDAVDADIAALDAEIEAHLAPFADAVARLDEIPGIGPIAAAVIIAEIGIDMTRFPTAGHLCSWAKFAPGIKSSAGKNKGNGSTGHGNRYLARVLGEAAVDAGRTDTFLGARYRRIARRRGKKKAIVAVGRSILVIIWHLLADPETRFHDLGADHYDRHVNTAAKKRSHIRQLEALGYRRHPRTRRLTHTSHSPAPLAPPGAAACLVTVHSRTRWVFSFALPVPMRRNERKCSRARVSHGTPPANRGSRGFGSGPRTVESRPSVQRSPETPARCTGEADRPAAPNSRKWPGPRSAG